METSAKKYLNWKSILAYSLGLFGLQAVVFYLNSYQAEFYASTMQADFAVVGVILLAAKVASAIFDPILGNVIEARKPSRFGKLRPYILYSIVPLIALTILIFVKVPLRGTALYVYIFVTYTLWCMAMTMGDVPSQGMAAVLTPNPDERTNVISIANTLKSIGQAAPYVVVPVICLIVPGGAKFDGIISSTEYLVNAIFIAIAGCGLFSLIFFCNKETVNRPYDKMTFRDMWAALKNNKPLMLVVLSYLLGFGRQMAMGIQLQAANVLLGGANKIILLGITTAIGTMISMAVTPLLVKKFDERKTFIGLSVYGFIISVATFFVGYDKLWLMLIFLFLLGLQFGAVNIMPMIMVADSVDYYEVKTGKRTEGVAYAVLSMCIKITLAMGVALGLILLQVFHYDAQATGDQITEGVKRGVYFTYTVVPGITSLLAAIPIFFYPLVGKRKREITEQLDARKKAAEENEATADAASQTVEITETDLPSPRE